MCCRCRIWLRSLFLCSFPFLWNVLCGRGQLNTLGGGVQPFGDSRSDDLRSTIPFVILESSTKKGSHTLPTTPEKKEETMSKQTENNINLTLTLITIVSALLMWRQDYGHVVMAITSITFLLSSTALFAHFIKKLDA